jgi:phospholipid/cholesterol/gamma-HCH transport system substrate-binding protein
MKPIRERNPVAVGLAGLAVCLVIGLLAFFSGSLPLIGNGTTYTAYFTEAAGLTPGNGVRVAGVQVGKVTGVSLAGDQVKVTFAVKGTWIGDQSTASIQIETLLGTMYLSVDPAGPAPLTPSQPIPASRTTSPYTVTTAFEQLGSTAGQLDTKEMAQSLEALAKAFANTPPYVRESLTGLASLSKTISSQDVQIADLVASARGVTGQLAGEDSNFQKLITDGNLLLAELQQQQSAIGSMLTGTEALATQLSGLVRDDQAKLSPTLHELNDVVTVLQDNQASLSRALSLLGPYYRLLGNVIGNGPWFDAYLCGLEPANYGGTHAPPYHGTPAPASCIPPKAGGGS